MNQGIILKCGVAIWRENVQVCQLPGLGTDLGFLFFVGGGGGDVKILYFLIMGKTYSLLKSTYL